LTRRLGPDEPGSRRRGRTGTAAPPAAGNGTHADARLNGRRAAGSPALTGDRAAVERPAEATAAKPGRRRRPVAPPPPPTAVPAPPAEPRVPDAPSAPPPPEPSVSAARRSGARARSRAASPPADVAPGEPDRTGDLWDERIADLLAFARRRITGEYEVDDFGFDPDLTDTLLYPFLRQIYRHYFRVEVSGTENLPDGSALIVANHSGTIPVDATMLTIAVHDEAPGHKHLRLLGADLVFRVPILSELARKTGSTLACNPDAERLLRQGEYVGVFPEGFKGIGKLYKDRYKLQRFGRGGFVSAALRTGAPIVPVSIVGAEEIYPIIGNIKPLAKITGLPYVPITPLFPWLGPIGMLPLPSKWLIEFGKPIETTEYADEVDDPIVVFNLADQVRETIQQTLHTLLERRPDPFS
jgi:1-acyl-sn-glycerol-3-phosphate acyltransferase